MAQKQKVALVTGSVLNIGSQIALHLARDGYRVMNHSAQFGGGCA